jgi:hypothetical protein
MGSEAPFLFIYVWNSTISEEFVGFGMVGILPMVVDSLDGIDYLTTSQIMLVNAA